MTPVNLMPLERRIKQMTRRRTRAWLRFLRTYSIILAVGSVLVMLPAHAGSANQEGAVARLDSQIKKAQEGIEARKKKIAGLDVGLETSRFVGEHPDWSLVMEAVSRARMEPQPVGVAWGRQLTVPTTTIALEKFELGSIKEEAKPAKAQSGAAGSPPQPAAGAPKTTPGGEMHTIRIAGFATSPIGALQFVRRLERLEFAQSVVVKETRSQALGKVMLTHFDIEITIPGDRTQANAAEGGSK